MSQDFEPIDSPLSLSLFRWSAATYRVVDRISSTFRVVNSSDTRVSCLRFLPSSSLSPLLLSLPFLLLPSPLSLLLFFSPSSFLSAVAQLVEWSNRDSIEFVTVVDPSYKRPRPSAGRHTCAKSSVSR